MPCCPDAHETVIRLGDRVIFSEPGGWENYERFIEVAEILRAHYGTALKDLVPIDRSKSNLWGDYGRTLAKGEEHAPLLHKIRTYTWSEHPWWELALNHLEEQWPEKLERLLNQGKLKDHLDNLVEKCKDQAEAEQAAPGSLLTVLLQTGRGPVADWLAEKGVGPVPLPGEKKGARKTKRRKKK